jgi:quinol monooxygenase YgiN
MIIVRIMMNARPEKQKEVMQTLLSIIESSEKDNRYMSYGIFCDIEDNNVFNLISEWETRKDLDDHMKSYRFSVLLGTKSLLCEPLQIGIHTVSHSEGMEAIDAVRSKKTQ